MDLYHQIFSILSVYLLLIISIHCFPHEMEKSDDILLNGNPMGEDEVSNPNDPSHGSNIYLTDLKTGVRVAKWNKSMKMNPHELGGYIEGDILNPADINRNGQINRYYRWPGGVIPYVIQGGFNQQQRNLIFQAMNDFHRYTCIRFVPRTNQRDYIRILSGNSGCWSSVGRVGGAQVVNLQIPGCITLKGTPVHELMHTVGFFHEQSRLDRDNYVNILWGNIQNGLAHAFDKAKNTDPFGQPYDYHSVMHYSAYAFSKNRQPTIIPKRPVQGELGQRYGFSQSDVNRIWRMYGCRRTTLG